MKHLKTFEDEIKSRKKDGFLNVTIDNVTYKSWFFNPYSINSGFKQDLVSNDSWVVAVEDKYGVSKTYTVNNCLNVSPYVLDGDYLNSKKARQILIDNVEIYHNSKKYDTDKYKI